MAMSAAAVRCAMVMVDACVQGSVAVIAVAVAGSAELSCGRTRSRVRSLPSLRLLGFAARPPAQHSRAGWTRAQLSSGSQHSAAHDRDSLGCPCSEL